VNLSRFLRDRLRILHQKRRWEGMAVTSPDGDRGDEG